jgi:2-polyprenyl-3-methyl-5-hydroxy-6-metoxy-1,4-benzoquinol methylase
MDDPNSDRSRLFATLDQFRLTNRLFSRYRVLLTRHIMRDMEFLQRTTARPLTVLEIGSGGCDVAIWLARACRKREIRVHITCIDNDPRVASYARRRITASRESDRIDFRQCSAFDVEELPDFDYVICGNTFHHFTEDQARTLLQVMRKKASRRFFASDLARSPVAWIAFLVFSTIFLHGSFARYDGLLSLARAFSRTELHSLVPQGNHSVSRVRRLFPSRLYVVGEGLAQAG